MSDYLFLMESRLSPDQWNVVMGLQKAAESLGMNLYLVGGAIRDLIAGFPIDDLDFVVEGKALKLVRELSRGPLRVLWQEEESQAAEMEFPPAVLASISMARLETVARQGSKPVVTPGSILSDLRRRDFSINAIGVSLSPNSRGLLLDPANGLADLEKREIRTLYSASFYDEPVRIFRAVRLRTRLRFTLEPKTAAQFQNAKTQGAAETVSGDRLAEELREIARDRNPAEILKALEKEHLLRAWSPRLQGSGKNWQAITRATKAAQTLAQAGMRAPSFPVFLYLLVRKLPPRERSEFVKRLNLPRPEREAFQKLEPGAKALAKELSGKAANSPAKLYQLLAGAPADLILLVQVESPQKKIQSRIKTYLEKYRPLRSRLPEKELQQLGVAPGTPRSQKILTAYFYGVLEGKLKTKSEQAKFLSRAAQEKK